MPDPQRHFEPLTAGELLDRAIRLYLRNFSLLLGMSAVIHLPSIPLEFVRAARNAAGTRVTFSGAMLELLASMVSLFVISPLTGGTAAQIVSDIYLGNSVTLTGALKTAWSKYGTLLKSSFIPVLAILAGTVMLVVPGILWYLSYIFITPVVMIEGIAVSRAIRMRSRELVRGFRGKAFVIVALIVLIEILARAGIRRMLGFFLGAAGAAGVAPILSYSVVIVSSPMFALSITLLYYDLRIRKEGFDLEMLSRSLDTR